MGEAPSLFSLCLESISVSIISGCDDEVQELFQLPSDFVDSLVRIVPPIALQKLHELSRNTCGRGGLASADINYGRKRGRYDDFNSAWKKLYMNRWPENTKKTKGTHEGVVMSKPVGGCSDWQQLYWEAHLQNCLDETAERAFLPASVKHLAGVQISDKIMNSLGYCGISNQDCSKLSYHCHNFGHYARHLRLQNVLCVPEICELLRASKMQGLVFRRIISKSHVDGVCLLLNQNKESLLTLEFTRCQLSPTSLNQIISSLYKEGSKIHGLQHLCIESSLIFASNSSLMPSDLGSFFSSGWSLESLHLRDTDMDPMVAKLIFNTLLYSSSGLLSLEISDNSIAGWLSKIDRHELLSSPMKPDASLKSLSVLNLRGNNLHKEDAEDLNSALDRMPNLRSLDISDNPIGDDGIRSLIPYFIKDHKSTCPISDIKIENCDLTSTGLTEFLKSLSMARKPLNSLSIADNDLGSSVAGLLSKFLGTSHLRVLNIEDVGLGPLGFVELKNEMSKDVELVHINISKNRGGKMAALFISELILHAPNLVSVDAGFNLMPDESLPVIIDALTKIKGKLEHLDLTGNTNLLRSIYTSVLSEFQHHGKPIVTIPAFPFSDAPYDADP